MIRESGKTGPNRTVLTIDFVYGDPAISDRCPTQPGFAYVPTDSTSRARIGPIPNAFGGFGQLTVY